MRIECMNLEEFKNKLVQDPEVKEEFDKLEPEYALIRATIDARIKAEMSQQELAEKSGVSRSDISRIENGKANPSYKMLCKLAKGLGMELKIEFVPTR